MTGLRTKLLLLTASVVVATALAVAFTGSRISTLQIERLSPPGTVPLPVGRLRDHVARNGLDGLAPLLDELAAATERRAVLVDDGGRLVAASPRSLSRFALTVAPDGSLTLRSDAEILVIKGPAAELGDGAHGRLARLYLFPPDGPRDGGPAASAVRSVNRGLLAAALGVALVALGITWALARRVLAPVDELTRASERLAAGDLASRVTVTSDDELGKLGGSFNAMATALERAEALRKEMVSDVAHELKTPLTNIRCQLEAIQDGLLRPDDATIRSLHDETMLLAGIVDDLQDLSLADAGRLTLHRAPTSLPDVVRQAADAHAAAARVKGVSLAVEIAPDLPQVDADPRRLAQVLRNLLSNALAATPRDGAIEVTVSRNGDAARLVVRDTGIGIAAEHLPRLFERFYRTDPSRTRGTGGAGLGLAVVKQLVDAHGGSVSAESVAGKGSAFTVTLPLAPNSAFTGSS